MANRIIAKLLSGATWLSDTGIRHGLSNQSLGKALIHQAIWRPILLAALLTLTACTQATTHTGQVVAITDGDTIKILTPAKQQIKVRLADIDTPERGQPYGRKARQVLGDKIHRRQVEVEEVDIDRYQRLVGRVFLDGRNINAEMVEDGAAWVYRKYSDDPQLLDLERQAREQGRGLWALQPDQRMPPWEWRKQRR